MDMLIHAFAQHTGVSAKTIRYYESVGLLPPPRRAANQYRLYTEHDATLLQFIVGARSLGYPLADIARFLAVRENGSLPCDTLPIAKAKGLLALLRSRLLSMCPLGTTR